MVEGVREKIGCEKKKGNRGEGKKEVDGMEA